jgi:hypothetical protein
VLMVAWAGIPLLLWVWPDLGGLMAPAQDLRGWVHDVGIAWLALGAAGLFLRVGQLWLTQDAMQALAWLSKILSDPFHDIWLYHKAPLHLLRGELIDPMTHVGHASAVQPR